MAIDALTRDFLDELDRRSAQSLSPTTALAQAVPASPQQATESLWASLGRGEQPEWLVPPEKKSGPIHFVGAALWHAVDTALFSIPSLAFGMDYYKWEELGGGAKAGAVIGEALGFLAPIKLVGALTGKAVKAASKYGSTKATTRAVDAAKSVARNKDEAEAIGKTVGKVFTTKAAKKTLPQYEISTAKIEEASREMGELIKGSLRTRFPEMGPELLNNIVRASVNGLGQKGVHVNKIGQWVERALNMKFSIADKSAITSYIGRAAELTASFSLYNLIDDGIKSQLVEGHEFDPAGDIGHALMFSAFLPAVEAIPWGGKMRFLKTRKDVRSGIDKIHRTNYDALDIEEINALFRILSFNNRLQHSSFAVAASRKVGNVFKKGDEKEAALALKGLFQHFNPREVYKQMYKEMGKDLAASIPKMAIGAAYFNASTLLDANMLRNVDPEILGAHLLVGALFTRRYKPIKGEKFPTLNDFDRKVEFLRILGYDAESIKSLGQAFGIRGNLGYAYTGLLQNEQMRQVVEMINTKDHKEQSVQGVKGVGELDSDAHSLILKLHKLYVLSENSRKIGLEDANIEPDVLLNRLRRGQLEDLEAQLRTIKLPDGELLTEQNFWDFRVGIFKDISNATFQSYLKTVTNIARELGIQVEESFEPGSTKFDITKSTGIGRISGIRATDGDSKFDSIRQYEIIVNILKGYGFVHDIVQTAEQSKMAKDINSKVKDELVQQHLGLLTKALKEDNYEESTVVDIKPERNQFLSVMGNYRRERTLNAIYDFVEGRTDKLTKSDRAVYNEILNLLPEGSKIGKINKPKKMSESDWRDKLGTDEFMEVDTNVRALSEIMSNGVHGKIKSVDVDYEEARAVLSVLKRNGYKINLDMAHTFQDFYFRRLLDTSNMGAMHIAIATSGLEWGAFRLGEKDGRRVLIYQEREFVERTLSRDQNREEVISDMEKYDAIMSDMKAISGAFITPQSEMPFTKTSSSDLHNFIIEAFAATTKADKNVGGMYRKVKKEFNNKAGVVDAIDDVIKDMFDLSDPDNPVAKPLTLEDAEALKQSLREVKKTAGNDMSFEMQNLIDQLSFKLDAKNVGEEGMIAAHGNPLLALKMALKPEALKLYYVNEIISKIIFNQDNNPGDKLQGRIRMDRLVAELTVMLREKGLEVKEGTGLDQLASKFFNSGLTIEEKMEKGYKLKLEDFVDEVNNHIDAWSSSLTDAEYFEGIKKYKDTYGDSSLKDRDTDVFKKTAKEVNRLSEYNDFFKAERFVPAKEELKLAFLKNDIDKATLLIEDILNESQSGYKLMHKDSPDAAKREFDEFKHSVLKELVFGVAGTHVVRSVKLKYGGQDSEGNARYLLWEGKMVSSEVGASKIIRLFEKHGVYAAVAESEAIVIGADGKRRVVSNLFAETDIDSRFFDKADLSSNRAADRERRRRDLIKPKGTKILRIPVSFNTQLILDKTGHKEVKGVLADWYNEKVSILEQAVSDQLISPTALSNYKKMFGNVLREGYILKDNELSTLVFSMYWDKMNNAAFNRIMIDPSTSSHVNPILADMFKYMSTAEGIGAKTAGSEIGMRVLRRLNMESPKHAGEILTTEQSGAIDYAIDKGKFEVVSVDDSRYFDSKMIVKRQLALLREQYPDLAADADYTEGLVEELMTSLHDKSGIDSATYPGTNMWHISLLQKGREKDDGSGGIKQSIAHNDGLNTMLLKENFTYDPHIAAILDGLGIDILTFDSAAKEFSKKQIDPGRDWDGETLPIFFSRALGTDADLLRREGHVQDINFDDILYVKSEDRHKVTNITYALSEFLDAAGYNQYLKKYANYDGILSSANELIVGMVGRGPARMGIAEFILNVLSDEGAIIDGATNAYVKVMVSNGIDPKQGIIANNVRRIAYRTIVNRLRKPQTDGSSYSTMIPFLEGDIPFYSEIGVQTRFGGKKLAFADRKIPVNDFDKVQYIVELGASGREILMGKNEAGKWAPMNLEKSDLSSGERTILKSKLKYIDSLISGFKEGTNLGVLHEKLIQEGIWLESLSLRMPNLAADVAVHKVQDFWSEDMGNVVGINVLDLATKHQGDFDGDMGFNYTDTRFELTNAVGGLVPRRMDAYVYEPTDFDFQDVFSNGQTLGTVGSNSVPTKMMDNHVRNYNVSQNLFGQMKRFSAGINSLNRIRMSMIGIDGNLLELDGNVFNTYLQRHSNVLQSLISTTKQANWTNHSTADELKRFILFGDLPKSLVDSGVDLRKYNEEGYRPPIDLDKVRINGKPLDANTKDVYKDAIVEIVATLGRPSRVMSDLFDGSGRRVPDQNDLIDMRRELDFISFNPSQYIFNALIRRYKKGDQKRDALLKMFYDIPEGTNTETLRRRLVKGKFTANVVVEKTPFSFLGKSEEVFDSTPAGYVLNRIGSVRNTYQRAAAQYGVDVKRVAKSLDMIENFIALSDAESHQEIMEVLRDADSEENGNSISFAFTGDVFETKISDIAYAQKYSVAYHLLGMNARSIRSSLRRNSKSNSKSVLHLQNKLRRIQAIRAHMQQKEDGLIGELLKGEEGKAGKGVLEHFSLRDFTLPSPKYIPNAGRSRVFVYKEGIGSAKGKWSMEGEIGPKSSKRLGAGRYVILNNPLRYTPMSTSGAIDAYSLLSVVGDIQAINIRGFSGDVIQEARFVGDVRWLKSQISALASETYRISEGDPDAAENWSYEKEFEDNLVDKFMENYILEVQKLPTDTITMEAEFDAIHDMVGYVIKPDPVFGNITNLPDRNVALPSFKINNRVVNAMFRWLTRHNYTEILEDIARSYGTNFRRRYDNVPDLQYSSMYSDGIYRDRNTPAEGKSEVYNLIAESNPDFLYTPAISEILKNEMTARSAKISEVKDVDGDLYKIMRFGRYEDIKVGLDIFVDPKSTGKESNTECY